MVESNNGVMWSRSNGIFFQHGVLTNVVYNVDVSMTVCSRRGCLGLLSGLVYSYNQGGFPQNLHKHCNFNVNEGRVTPQAERCYLEFSPKGRNVRFFIRQKYLTLRLLEDLDD